MAGNAPRAPLAVELDRRSGVALWRQIEEILAGEIAGGITAPGGRLGTEQLLARRFGVNRHTVRQAIASLEQRGLVQVERGSGTYVREPLIDYTIGRRTRFSEVLARQGQVAGGALLYAGAAPAEAPAARALGLEVGEPVLILNILRKADARPIGIGAHHFPLPRFSGLDRVYRTTGSITAALRRFGVLDYLRASTRVSACAPSPDDAAMLEQPEGCPVLVTESVNIDRDGQPIEYGLSRLASEWVQLVIES